MLAQREQHPTGGKVYQIVYLSRARYALDEAQVVELATLAAGRNQLVGVTGLLLYDGARFIQALEGPQDAVIATMERIVSDDRHDMIRYFNRGSSNDRQFGDWSMDFKRAPGGCCSTEFLDRVKEDVNSVRDPHLRAAFIGFAALGAHRPKGYLCAAG